MKPIFVIFLYFWCISSIAQKYLTTPAVRPNMPSSPQAEAFVKLGEYSVNNNYGKPDISIPLYNIDFHGFQVPLTLRYEAQPLHPGYNYDVYGLGWTLSGNSCVARTIRDVADEFASNPFELDNFVMYDGKNFKTFKGYYKIPNANYKFDSYKIVLPSGRVIPFFMYKKDGKMYFDLMSIDKHVKIECITSTKSIDSFILKDEQGVKYTFDIADKASNIMENDKNATANVNWSLSKIEIPGKGNITFTYGDPVSITTFTKSEPIFSISRIYPTPTDKDISCSVYKFNLTKNELSPFYKMRLLKTIRYGKTEIEYSYDKNNLTSLVVSNSLTDTKKVFKFFIKDSKLEKLQIGNDNKNLIYRFAYTTKDPGTELDYWGNYGNSATKEDIGNFNIYTDINGYTENDLKHNLSQVSNRVLLLSKPSNEFPRFFKLKLQSKDAGDTRVATGPERHCVLKSITYPNGGKTYFDFEKHRFLTASGADGSFVADRTKQRIVEGGGFRIKCISNYAADGTLASCDNYCYGYTYADIAKNNIPFPTSSYNNLENHIGCGEPVVDPNIRTFLDYDYSTSTIPNGFIEMLLGIPYPKDRTHTFEYPESIISYNYSWFWNIRVSALYFQNLLAGREPVAYPEITIYHGGLPNTNKCIGKTVLSYNIYRTDYNSESHYMCEGTNLRRYTAYFEPVRTLFEKGGKVLVCDEIPECRNQLIKKSNYGLTSSNKWKLNYTEDYTYYEYSIMNYGFTYNNAYSQALCPMHNLSISVGRNEEYIYLHEFYSPKQEKLGCNKICSVTRRQYDSNNPSIYLNTLEKYSYVYGDQVRTKNYWDVVDKQDDYTFVGDNVSLNDITEKMSEKNMLAIVESATTSAYSYMGPLKIDGYKMTYNKFNSKNDIYPETISMYNGSGWVETIKVLSYSAHGNPLEIVDLTTGIHTSYLWGYDDCYLIAEVQNATQDEVKAACSSLNTDMPKLSELNNMRNKLPDSLIKTWTYQPLVGVSEYTDENGMTMEYEYDDLGRLITEWRIATRKREKVKTYEYNFKN